MPRFFGLVRLPGIWFGFDMTLFCRICLVPCAYTLVPQI